MNIHSPFVTRTIPHDGWVEYHALLDGATLPTECWAAAVADFLAQGSRVLLSSDVWGSRESLSELPQAFLDTVGRLAPCSRLVSGASSRSPDYLRLHALSGLTPQKIESQDRVIGHFFEDAHARYCVLGDATGHDTSLSAGQQTEAVFASIEKALGQGGFDFRDVVRTWFYLDQILDWYGDFNRVRTEYFLRHGVFDHLVPASTGIGTANGARSALLAKVQAQRPKTELAMAMRVESPLQGEATAYGSSFSRAVELSDPVSNNLHISGTASIDTSGKSVHLGDTWAQMELTLQVVEALLEAQGMSWEDTVGGLAYFRNAEDMALWENLPPALRAMPVALTHCVVCRQDLLFELELQAAHTVRR